MIPDYNYSYSSSGGELPLPTHRLLSYQIWGKQNVCYHILTEAPEPRNENQREECYERWAHVLILPDRRTWRVAPTNWTEGREEPDCSPVMSGARPEASIANGEERPVSGGWPTGERPPDARTGSEVDQRDLDKRPGSKATRG